MIRAVRAVATMPDGVRIEVTHRTYGPVINTLTFLPDGAIGLAESKPSYDAEFRFEPVRGSDDGLRVRARIWLKRGLGWLCFAAPPVVRSRMRRFLVDPLRRRAAELAAADERDEPPIARNARTY